MGVGVGRDTQAEEQRGGAVDKTPAWGEGLRLLTPSGHCFPLVPKLSPGGLGGGELPVTGGMEDRVNDDQGGC